MKKIIPHIFLLNRFAFTLTFCFFIFTSSSQTVTTGKSYINITRPSGGTFLPGDIIEIRATIAVSGGSSGSPVSQIRYNDTIPAKCIYVANTLRLLSNEGRLQRQFTDANDADSANIDLPTGHMRFNIGSGAGASNVLTQGNGTTNAGSLWGALRPSFYGSTCIRIYSYRIQISNVPAVVDFDTTVVLSAGNFRYRNGGMNYTSGFPIYHAKIFPNYGLCSNAIGTNALVSEFNGTFGSGNLKNRGISPLVPAPYSWKLFSSNTPNDNFYGVANNTSGNWGTNANVAYPHTTRVFNVWDIIGDHTGAANQFTGNNPTDTTISSGGYALIINASYEPNQAFTQTITGLCENTYYEFSAWFRNICRRCGCDSSGKGAMTAGYVSGPGNDSSGVRPNLTFQIDGKDYYTTGNLAYSGLWEKKGFLYLTKTGQTSFTITIRNNAPGGGGNDWAIDDISLATCTPNLTLNPNADPTICEDNLVEIGCTVKSFFNNYTYYKWQKSTDNGNTWNNTGVSGGPASPTWNGSEWVYTTNYPAFIAGIAENGDLYRAAVATTAANRDNINCTFSANEVITLHVIDCEFLATNIISFTGKVVKDEVSLKWTTSKENESLQFEIEKSSHGSRFTSIASIISYNDFHSEYNLYSFTDPDAFTGNIYYRIKMINNQNTYEYSRIIQPNSQSSEFSLGKVVNPFNNDLKFDLVSARNVLAETEIIDGFGKILKKNNFMIIAGVNKLTITNTNRLPGGIYTLHVRVSGKVFSKKVLKQNN